MAEEGAVAGGGDFTKSLGKKVGPLPLGAWIVIGGVIAWYVWKKQKGASSGSGAATDSAGNVGTIDPATGYVYGSSQDSAALSAGTDSGTGTSSTGVTSGSTTAGTYADNNAWARAAINFLVGLGVDPSVANEAVQQYLASQVLTPEQQGDVNLAIQGIGSPPELPGPIGTAPTSLTTPSSPSNGTTVTASNPPSGLVATPASTSVSLLWGSVTNATGYTVAYGTTSAASDGTQTVTGTSATVGGLNPGTMYYFTVQATPAKTGDPHASTTATTLKTSATPATQTSALPPGYGWFDTASSSYTADSIARRFGISVATLASYNGWSGTTASTKIPPNTHVKVRSDAGPFDAAAYKAL